MENVTLVEECGGGGEVCEGDLLVAIPTDSGLPDPAQNQSLNISAIVAILDEQQKSYLGPAAKVCLVTVYSLLITVGILANTVVAIVIAHRQELRTPRNLYIINLTVSDLSMCVVCMPFTLVGLLHKDYTLGNFICKLVPVLQCTNILVSTATIVAIAADRYFTIVCVSRNRDASDYVPGSVAAIWLFSLVFPLPLFAYYFVQKVKFGNYVLFERCVEMWSSAAVKVAWTVALLVMQYVIPILVLSIVHGRINTYLSSHQMSQRDARRAQREIERNRRTTSLLTSIAATFAVSWLPWHVVNLLADFNYVGFQEPEFFYVVFGSCHAVAMSSVCVNPVLYGWFNTNLRRELTQTSMLLLRKMTCQVSTRDSGGERERPTTQTISQPAIESVSLLVYQPKAASNSEGEDDLEAWREGKNRHLVLLTGNQGLEDKNGKTGPTVTSMEDLEAQTKVTEREMEPEESK